MFGLSVRRTSAGLSRPGWRWSRSAWPTGSWIPSGPASTSVSIAASMSSIPASIAASPGMPWSTATSKHRPDVAWKSRLRRYCFTPRTLSHARRRTQPDHRPDARHRRAAPGRGAALRRRGRDPGWQGPERRAGRAGARPPGAAGVARARADRRGGGRDDRRRGREAARGPLPRRAALHRGHPGARRPHDRAQRARAACGGGGVDGVRAGGGVEWTAYERAVRTHLEAHTIRVCSGSVPPGSPPDAYRRLSALAQEAGVACLVDAAGGTLLRALDAAPSLVTPNLAEAEGVLGLGPRGQAVRSADDARPRALAAAEALVRQAPRAAVVTADPEVPAA